MDAIGTTLFVSSHAIERPIRRPPRRRDGLLGRAHPAMSHLPIRVMHASYVVRGVVHAYTLAPFGVSAFALSVFSVQRQQSA